MKYLNIWIKLNISCRKGTDLLIYNIFRPFEHSNIPYKSKYQLQEEDGGQHILRNERIQTVYSYSLFHVTLCLANMYKH